MQRAFQFIDSYYFELLINSDKTYVTDKATPKTCGTHIPVNWAFERSHMLHFLSAEKGIFILYQQSDKFLTACIGAM